MSRYTYEGDLPLQELPYWKNRVTYYLKTADMPFQWTTAHLADRRCARCGRVLRGYGKAAPRDIPACSFCRHEVDELIIAFVG